MNTSDVAYQSRNQPILTFYPMRTNVANNTAAPVEGQDGRLKLQLDDNLMAPHICLQLAKATEWFFHWVGDEQVKVCIPKDVKKYERRAYTSSSLARCIYVRAWSKSDSSV